MDLIFYRSDELSDQIRTKNLVPPLPFKGNIVDIQAIMVLKREKREGVTLNGLDSIQFNMALKPRRNF